jgi:hypothetical protein
MEQKHNQNIQSGDPFGRLRPRKRVHPNPNTPHSHPNPNSNPNPNSYPPNDSTLFSFLPPRSSLASYYTNYITSRVTHVLLSFRPALYSRSPFLSPHALLSSTVLCTSRLTRYLLHNLPNLTPYSLPSFFSPYLARYPRSPFISPRTLRVSCRTQTTLPHALLGSCF